MVHDIFHFRPSRLDQDVVLSDSHRVVGKLARYLTSFQLDAIRFLYKNFEKNHACILNDESGLGKTVVVAAFLSAILPRDGSKRCLVIVKDAERIVSWRFHLEVLTKLHVKVLVDDAAVENDGSVFLVPWETLRKSLNLARTVFNCVVLDDRGELTASKPCLNFFLRHFENRVSLIVASSDVTLETKHLHGLLRLCGRLDSKYQKLKVFEEQFSLSHPGGGQIKDRALLEAYFQRREKIINYCRDFRLRRYRHQFEDELPLVSPSVFERTIQDWREKELSKASVSVSSGSLKIISSSSEKNTEELFQTYFDSKTDKLLNDEVRSINENGTRSDISKDRSTHDTEEMSPLLFESDSEEFPLPAAVKPKQIDMNASERKASPSMMSKPRAEPTPSPCVENNCSQAMIESCSSTEATQKGRKSRVRRQNNKVIRSLRSTCRKTRHNAGVLSSRNAIIDVFRMVEQAEEKKAKHKRRRQCTTPNRQVVKEAGQDLGSASENEMNDGEKLEYHPDDVDSRSADVALARTISQASNHSFNIDLISKTLPPDSSEVQIFSQSDHIIVLSSSSEGSELSAIRFSKSAAPGKVSAESGKISPSPDIFESCDDCDFLCSQKKKSVTPEVRTLPQKIRQTLNKRITSSCLQRLEDDFRATNKSTSLNCRPELKKLGFTDIFTNMVQIHSTHLVGSLNAQTEAHCNKITRYLSSQSFDSSQPNRLDTTTKAAKDLEYYPKTPKRRMSTTASQKVSSPSLSKKSPKSQRHTPQTPNGLTKWLVKKTPDNTSQQSNTSRNARRKRLDLWFKD